MNYLLIKYMKLFNFLKYLPPLLSRFPSTLSLSLFSLSLSLFFSFPLSSVSQSSLTRLSPISLYYPSLFFFLNLLIYLPLSFFSVCLTSLSISFTLPLSHSLLRLFVSRESVSLFLSCWLIQIVSNIDFKVYSACLYEVCLLNNEDCCCKTFYLKFIHI